MVKLAVTGLVGIRGKFQWREWADTEGTVNTGTAKLCENLETAMWQMLLADWVL